MGLADHLTCLLRNLYVGQEAKVRTLYGTTDWFRIEKGVHQGFLFSPCFPGGSDGKESVCNVGDSDLIPGSGRSPRKGHGNPLQYFCLDNSIDRVTWQATVCGLQTVRHNWATKKSCTHNTICLHPVPQCQLYRALDGKICLTKPDTFGNISIATKTEHAFPIYGLCHL